MSRRDRHGRGIRGRPLPPRVPAWRSRSQLFDDLVLDAVQEVTGPWAAELADLEVLVQDVPPALADSLDGLVADGAAGEQIPLARALPGGDGRNPRLVVYRRPLELRAEDLHDLRGLLHEVAVDAVAELLGIDPHEVDPDQG
ncbi:MAG: metallopeptidase family protein [Actinomycetota bacterium]|nr:metallopeptidase family protein [Actinomycetota bacterium]